MLAHLPVGAETAPENTCPVVDRQPGTLPAACTSRGPPEFLGTTITVYAVRFKARGQLLRDAAGLLTEALPTPTPPEGQPRPKSGSRLIAGAGTELWVSPPAPLSCAQVPPDVGRFHSPRR